VDDGHSSESGDEIDAALAAVQRTCGNAIAAIRSTPGSQERINAAGRLADLLRDRFEEVARLRHEEAVQIWETEKLSLAALAQRVGISKARADQIIRAHRKDDGRDGA